VIEKSVIMVTCIWSSPMHTTGSSNLIQRSESFSVFAISALAPIPRRFLTNAAISVSPSIEILADHLPLTIDLPQLEQHKITFGGRRFQQDITRFDGEMQFPAWIGRIRREVSNLRRHRRVGQTLEHGIDTICLTNRSSRDRLHDHRDQRIPLHLGTFSAAPLAHKAVLLLQKLVTRFERNLGGIGFDEYFAIALETRSKVELRGGDRLLVGMTELGKSDKAEDS
jgi:hypothetical protein